MLPVSDRLISRGCNSMLRCRSTTQVLRVFERMCGLTVHLNTIIESTRQFNVWIRCLLNRKIGKYGNDGQLRTNWIALAELAEKCCRIERETIRCWEPQKNIYSHRYLFSDFHILQIFTCVAETFLTPIWYMETWFRLKLQTIS